MGNADPGLHASGRFHATAANDDDGVAEAIEKFVLQEQGPAVGGQRSEEELSSLTSEP
jgi:hypothetical protein